MTITGNNISQSVYYSPFVFCLPHFTYIPYTNMPIVFVYYLPVMSVFFAVLELFPLTGGITSHYIYYDNGGLLQVVYKARKRPTIIIGEKYI